MLTLALTVVFVEPVSGGTTTSINDDDACARGRPSYSLAAPVDGAFYGVAEPVRIAVSSSVRARSVPVARVVLLDERGEPYGDPLPLAVVVGNDGSQSDRAGFVLATQRTLVLSHGRFSVYVVDREPASSACPGDHSSLIGSVTFVAAPVIDSMVRGRLAQDTIFVEQSRFRQNAERTPATLVPTAPSPTMSPQARPEVPALISRQTADAARQIADAYRAIGRIESTNGAAREEILRYYASDALVFVPDRSPATGEAILGALSSRGPAAYGTGYETETPLRLDVSGDRAIDVERDEIGSYAYKLPGSDVSIRTQFCEVAVWKLDRNETWRIATQSFIRDGDSSPCAIDTSK